MDSNILRPRQPFIGGVNLLLSTRLTQVFQFLFAFLSGVKHNVDIWPSRRLYG